MPLHIINKNEVRNEDDSPLPANTPSTGSLYDNSRVFEGGNRVLKLLEQQKKAVQSKMIINEHGLRVLLDKNRTMENIPTGQVDLGKSKRVDGANDALASRDNKPGSFFDSSKITQLYNDAIDKGSSKNSHMVRLSLASACGNRETSRRNPQGALSDEYLDVPNTSTTNRTTVNEGILVTSSPRNDFHYDPLFHHGQVPALQLAGEEREIEEVSWKNDDGNNANNSNHVPRFASRVQFQTPFPQGRALNQDEAFDIEANIASTDTNKDDHVKSSEISIKSRPSRSSKHRADKDKSSTRHGNGPRGGPASGASESDSDMSRTNSSTGTVAPSTWQSIGSFWQENFWIILVFGALLILLLGYYLMTRNGTRNENYDADDSFISSKPKVSRKYSGPVI